MPSVIDAKAGKEKWRKSYTKVSYILFIAVEFVMFVKLICLFRPNYRDTCYRMLKNLLYFPGSEKRICNRFNRMSLRFVKLKYSFIYN